MNNCVVCDWELGEPLYRSPQPRSITSLCEVLPHGVTVHFCDRCGHLQTGALGDLAAYYNQSYKILIASEDEDQLYTTLLDGRKVFRTEHQVETLMRLAPPRAGARVLDYGCAKSSTLRALFERRPDVAPHCFDVSELYEPFWRKFLPEGNWAVHTTPPSWKESFDLITSFFALEHTARPQQFAHAVADLLRPGGTFYGIVPNTYANPADFLVADHVNHFSSASLQTLLARAGLHAQFVESSVHNSAWVFAARKVGRVEQLAIAAAERTKLHDQAAGLGRYWGAYASAVTAFEERTVTRGPAAIYGSGFYGTSIASNLREPERIVCFLDQNPHRQKHTLLGKPILPPEALPSEVRTIYVGLNPTIARSVAEAPLFRGRELEYFLG